MLTVIEKVILLQNIDVFKEVSTEQLSYLAAIAEEREFTEGERIYSADDVADSMFVVIEGRVRLHRGEVDVTAAGAREAFGTWALFDDKPRVVSAVTTEPTRVLRIAKEDFIDLLADHIEITQGVMKAIVRRLHSLLGRVSSTDGLRE